MSPPRAIIGWPISDHSMDCIPAHPADWAGRPVSPVEGGQARPVFPAPDRFFLTETTSSVARRRDRSAAHFCPVLPVNVGRPTWVAAPPR